MIYISVGYHLRCLGRSSLGLSLRSSAIAMAKTLKLPVPGTSQDPVPSHVVGVDVVRWRLFRIIIIMEYEETCSSTNPNSTTFCCTRQVFKKNGKGLLCSLLNSNSTQGFGTFHHVAGKFFSKFEGKLKVSQQIGGTLRYLTYHYYWYRSD